MAQQSIMKRTVAAILSTLISFILSDPDVASWATLAPADDGAGGK